MYIAVATASPGKLHAAVYVFIGVNPADYRLLNTASQGIPYSIALISIMNTAILSTSRIK
jgi:hypothetical protein